MINGLMKLMIMEHINVVEPSSGLNRNRERDQIARANAHHDEENNGIKESVFIKIYLIELLSNAMGNET